MPRCLTQHEIDVSLWIIMAASALAVVAATAAITWTRASATWRGDRRRLPFLVLAAGLLLFLAVRGQFWTIAALLPSVALAAVVGHTLQRVPTEGPGRRGNPRVARYGLPSIAACCAVVAAATAIWVFPADVCG